MEHVARTAVPVFPLPEIVLFPGVMIPLHVFELRYRTMVRDTLSRDRMIALGVLRAGYELDYHGSPAFHPLGCLAHVEEVEWLPNDRYDLKVLGKSRVRFGRIEREFPYRMARVELLPQHPYAEDDPLVELDKRALLDLYARLTELAKGRGGDAAVESMPQVQPADSYETVVNSVSTICGHSVDERLALLAEDSLLERGRIVRQMLERALGAPRKSERPEAPGGERN